MRPTQIHGWLGCCLIAALLCADGCSQSRAKVDSPTSPTSVQAGQPIGFADGLYRGFDRNDYPGDATMASLHATFAFTGYWLTNPPGETANTWLHKRAILRQQGWGFLVLANGRLDAEILKAQKRGTAPAALGRQDAATAIAAARAEGFPPRTILFLDQEEGGAMLPEQAAYLLGWTEAVAAGGFRAGLYASGQPVPNGPPIQGQPQTITTIEDVRSRVTAGHLHEIAIFDYQDACPPAPGCTLQPKPLAAAGEPQQSDAGPLIVWQYAQSPRRPEITRSCAATYAADGNCYAPGFPGLFLDLDASSTSDPSAGR